MSAAATPTASPPAAPAGSFVRSLLFPGVFVLAYSIAAAAYCLSIGNHEFLFYVAVMLVLGCMIAGIHRAARFSTACLWALAFWGLAHMAGGLIKVPGQTGVLYNLWLVGSGYGRGIKYDNLAHAYGFGVATWAAWQCLRRSLADPAPRFAPLFAAVMIGEGLGALNEIIEFSATRIMPKTNVGDYANNAWDLVFNLAGCILAAVLIRIGSPRVRERRGR
ncbi:MAG: DUF2238 domain-containing protein [Phycisphaerales bacterium]